MQIAVLTHTGLVRQKNEDNYLLLPEAGFFAVADGMGGHQAGAFASDLALKIVKENIFLNNHQADHQLLLKQLVEKANAEIYALSLKEQDKEGMGTTFTALWLQEKLAFVAHVGDSRAYLLKNGELLPLTDDHSLVGELMRNGSLTLSEAQSHPKKHLLTRALGAEANVKVDINKISWGIGDLFFLCTDGLTNLVNDEEIKKILAESPILENSLEKLMELAFQRGGQDNITMLAILMK